MEWKLFWTVVKCDTQKEIVVIVPFSRDVRHEVKFVINGESVAISAGYGGYNAILSVSHRLPAGTQTLEIKAVGKPGAVFAVRDVQLFQ